ncbi:MAG: hypothetical protein JWN50_772 [Parcubacteria group bacterium]|nr:hypothetical protein [Parcubacteria group bacterium]
MPNEINPELTPEEREERIQTDIQTLAELVIEAMEACIADGSWDPREGVAGLEKMLAREEAREG